MTLSFTHPTARLMLSAVIIFAVLAAVAGVSSALLSDSVTIENSTFATGTVDLLIAIDNEGAHGTYGESIGGANVTGLLPGGTDDSFMFWLRNASNSDASLDISGLVMNVVGNEDLQANLMIGFTCDVGNDGVITADGVIAPKSLDDWQTSLAEGFTPIVTLAAEGTADSTGADEAKCTMNAELDDDSTASGASATFDALFTGTQVVPTPAL